MKVELTEKQIQESALSGKEGMAMRELEHELTKYTNPIVDNRVVSDMTFAARLRLYLISFDSGCHAWHEENRYLLDVANKLLDWQAQTATSEEEISYLKQLGFTK